MNTTIKFILTEFEVVFLYTVPLFEPFEVGELIERKLSLLTGVKRY